LPDAEVLTRGLGDGHVAMRASLKPYCSAKQGLAAIDAFQQLMADGADPASIEAVTVRVPTAYAAMVGHAQFPTARIPSIVSVRYQLALAAHSPDGLYDIRRDPPRRTAAIEALAARIAVIADDGLAADYPAAWPAEVTVRWSGGEGTRRVVDSAGDPARPFDRTAVDEKYRAVLGRLVPGADVRRWLDAIDGATRDPARLGALAGDLAAALRR
jgi:2-methylcitrate dehydratase PrpD